MNRAELRRAAQDHIMSQVAVALGYWTEANLGVPDEQADEFRAMLKAQADRAAKLYGFDEAWTA